MLMAAIAFVCAALVQIQIDVSRKQIFFSCSYLISGQKFIYLKLTIKIKSNYTNLFSENIAHIPIRLPESVEVT